MPKGYPKKSEPKLTGRLVPTIAGRKTMILLEIEISAKMIKTQAEHVAALLEEYRKLSQSDS